MAQTRPASSQITITTSANRGDAAVNLQNVIDAPIQYFNSPLTADRAVTFLTPGKFRIVRTAAATGAFNLNVGTGPLKALAVGQWCDVDVDSTGGTVVLTAFGSL